MPLRFSPRLSERLQIEHILWLTTLRADGMPLPTPVWFLWQADSFLIYSKPTALKVRNLQRHPQAALNFNSDFEGDDVAIFYGEAQLDRHAPYSPDYLAKYRDGILSLGMTPESYQRWFSLTIRLRPMRVREGGGELPTP